MLSYGIKQSLENLRKYCASPDCAQWRIMMKLNDSKRERLRRIQGARGDPHINNREPAVRPPFVTSCSGE
ncbi:unnamed protein product [Plutella xylostella]|uniref:(diamondback moth) hypothetical protein n=1 Tax=Plutella xylostella TaxID=51655 RepID=A0A8S4G2I9_PLUXY|nr:unnamed protein product [Plutella xylostella]